MIAWLWNALVGEFCRHRWEVIYRAALMSDPHGKMPYGLKWVLRCSKCGNIKNKRT